MKRLLPAAVLERFEKVFAPPLAIHVFRDVSGHAFASVRVPRSHQVIIGMSIDLFNAVADHIFEQTGRQIEKDFKVVRVRGPREEIPVSQPINPATVDDTPLPTVAQYGPLLLEPEPI